VKLPESRFADQVGAHCASPKCKAQVIWCHTKNKQMLVDADPITDFEPGGDFGNIKLVDTGDRQPLAVVLLVAQRFGRQGTLHVSHFATCPDAQRFRRKGYER
jgi:hypothetical protein